MTTNAGSEIKLNPGDTFFNLMDRLLRLPKPHLWFILNDPAGTGQVALANITTHDPTNRRRCGAHCLIVRHGEHPFVAEGHTSCVRYADVLYPLHRVEHAVKHPEAERREPLSRSLLRRVQLDLVNSPHTPDDVKDAVRASPR